MNALILRGKNKGMVVEISQWCNDWFSLSDGSIVSPTSIAFNIDTAHTIMEHNNNGIMFRMFEITKTDPMKVPMPYIFTFKRLRKHATI